MLIPHFSRVRKPDIYDDDALSCLIDMGFSLDEAKHALMNSANKQQAVDMLLERTNSYVKTE